MKIIEKYNLSTLSNTELRFLTLNILYSLEMLDYNISLEEILIDYNESFGLIFDENETTSKIKIRYTIKNIIEKRKELDQKVLSFLNKWSMDRISVINKLIIRYSIWEMVYENTDAALIINEAIELSKGYAELESYKFINGILDTFVKEKKIFDK